MPLISSHRYTREDLDVWATHERTDALHAQRLVRSGKIERSLDVLESFAREGRCYAGVSWGKDSVVLAHLVARLWRERAIEIPLVWVRVEPIVNPDCVLVRDVFLGSHAVVPYDEIETWCRRSDDGEWHASGTLEAGFAGASQRYGSRHVSGIRGAESGTRKLRMLRFGEATANTCAPIGWWPTADVFAYLYAYELPVHPAYALTMGGLYERDRLRVASIGGQRGTGHGRREWEERYYRDALRAIDAARNG